MEEKTNPKWGLIAGLLAYVLWGVLPFYWKAVGEVSALSILCYRVLWSFVFMLIVLLITKKLSRFWCEVREIIKNKKRLLAIIMAALLITANWFIFIFSVSSGKVIDASLGYYINPLVNVVLATVILKERLGRGELIACLLATVGVVLLAIQSGQMPWSSLAMAVTFSLYGLIKKTASVSSLTGLTIETAIMAPFAFIYLVFYSSEGFMAFDFKINLLLIGAGVVTAIPLFLFAEAAKNISYILVGFLQYIAPTLMLVAAIWQFGETFSTPQMIAFSFIWLGILIFTGTSVLSLRKNKLA
ncbi:EamA family transporter RarD [Vagococcus sp. DIV0080]|uniref:EamA family transporter RarD n=1 Tax=Candidatus Vagococcus giribetii TaxID=2230876 RepID=A0ABS3HRW9_9ENTE|nr:EamA family transporter RarD [Vagococcus sp. DIV0080]MBO0476381.1 EamA family transporter RarD [Vagococcus sp. DIV0080]